MQAKGISCSGKHLVVLLSPIVHIFAYGPVFWSLAAWTVAVSRSHPDPETEQFLTTLPVDRRLVMGSALKFVAVAEGLADTYPRLAPLSEWDVAAGHALVVAAGGSMQAPDGGALAYGARARNFRLGGFIAWGGPPAA